MTINLLEFLQSTGLSERDARQFLSGNIDRIVIDLRTKNPTQFHHVVYKWQSDDTILIDVEPGRKNLNMEFGPDTCISIKVS